MRRLFASSLTAAFLLLALPAGGAPDRAEATAWDLRTWLADLASQWLGPFTAAEETSVPPPPPPPPSPAEGVQEPAPPGTDPLGPSMDPND